MDLRATMTQWRERAAGWNGAERAVACGVVLTAAGLLAWAGLLWSQWRDNPDLSHGFFALPMLGLLARRAARDAGARPPGPGWHLAGVLAGAGLLAAATLLATAYVAAIGWSEFISLFLVSVALAAAVALTAWAAAGVRWIGAGWAAAVMPVVVALSAPLPPGNYTRLTYALQGHVTVWVVETLRLFGVPAIRVGNVINLGRTAVGVEEACSGVRSLLSCVLAGLVLSALLVRSPSRRVILIAVAGPLALVTNYLRSLLLTVLARNGVDIAGAWHDWLGLAVLAVTTALLGWLAFSMEEEPPTVGGPRNAEGRRSASWIVFAALAGAAAWMGFVATRTAVPVGNAAVAVRPAELAPAEPRAAGWRVATRGDLARFADVLHTDDLIERVYVRPDGAGGMIELTVYAAAWAPGRATVSAVASHTPDVCWPGAGWTTEPEAAGRVALRVGAGRALAEAEQRGFQLKGERRLVWFWHLVEGAPIRPFDPRSWRALVERFLSEGVPAPQGQLFLRVSCNTPWEEIADDPLIGELAEGFARAGVVWAGH